MIQSPRLPKPSPVWPPRSLPMSPLPSLPCPRLTSHWPPTPQPVMSLSHFLDLPDGSFLPTSSHLHSPFWLQLSCVLLRSCFRVLRPNRSSRHCCSISWCRACPSQSFLHPEEFMSRLSPPSEPVSSPVRWSVCQGGCDEDRRKDASKGHGTQ